MEPAAQHGNLRLLFCCLRMTFINWDVKSRAVQLFNHSLGYTFTVMRGKCLYILSAECTEKTNESISQAEKMALNKLFNLFERTEKKRNVSG